VKTELPTKPGPYYWRESDGDEWELGNVFKNYDKSFYFEAFNIVGKPVVDMGGQWLPIPTAEELVELLRLVDELKHASSRTEVALALRYVIDCADKLRKEVEL